MFTRWYAWLSGATIKASFGVLSGITVNRRKLWERI